MLLRMLLEIQAVVGNSIPNDVAVAVSRATGASISQICSTIAFYSMLSKNRRGQHIVRVCQSAPCFLAGSNEVAQAFLNELELDEANQTTSDGLFTFEHCQCLGHCDSSPAATVDDVIYKNLDPTSIGEIISDLKNVEGKS